ncbi:FHA domain-containing protein [Paenibacillus sp. GSMTC-2017]|uniref:DUF6382 domain-containing protein n=1 Tax=Paenibacillus sp. GSMTC-2017 TaxID=2794350 RepID=UPI0018D870CB|nr:DUF6382 domain-containing protein [Paenibacillus sp. GSMTC-2017]MBH5317467.1 FHA domain-containing protein [Paenibacillus sp. GSMTC-2017]
MHQFRIDFAMNRDHEMMIDLEGGINRSQLDEVELNMLRSVKVPYLLPIDWLEMNGKITFRYTLTGSKMVVHRLQQQPITMSQYYSLILAVTDALLECKQYMLRPEGCILNDQFIFTGERLGDIRLAYVPLKSSEEDYIHKKEDLLSLVVRWTSFVEPIDGAGLKRVLQLLNNNRLPLTELRDTLLDLISSKAEPISSEQAETRQNVSSQMPSSLQMKVDTDGEPDSATHPRRIESKPDMGQSQRAIDRANMSLEEGDDILPHEDTTFENIMKNRRKNKIIVAIFLVLAACLWRFVYVESPSNQNLLMSAGITLLLLASVLYIRKRNAVVLQEKQSRVEYGEALESNSEKLRMKKQWDMVQEQIPNTTNSFGSYAVPSERSASQILGGSILPTTVLGNALKEDENTMLLESTEGHSARLRRVWRGQEEEIELASESFKIGRATEGVGYAESADGVSRVHLEIERIDGEHHVKDLGSRNGSLLNGNLMVPYKSYKLATGDTIHLAGNKGPVYELQRG